MRTTEELYNTDFYPCGPSPQDHHQGGAPSAPAHWLLQRYMRLSASASSPASHQAPPDPWRHLTSAEEPRGADNCRYVAPCVRDVPTCTLYAQLPVPLPQPAPLPASLAAAWGSATSCQGAAPGNGVQAYNDATVNPVPSWDADLAFPSPPCPGVLLHPSCPPCVLAASPSLLHAAPPPGQPAQAPRQPAQAPWQPAQAPRQPAQAPRQSAQARSRAARSVGSAVTGDSPREMSALSAFLAAFPDRPAAYRKMRGGRGKNNNNNNNRAPNACPHCPKTFVKPRALRYHVASRHPSPATATLTAALTCRHCAKTFSCPSTLRTHMRTHTGERPYACAVCAEAFSDRSVWRRHQRVHSGYKPHVCRVCGLDFSQSGNLKRHVTTQHPGHVIGISTKVGTP